MSWYGAVQGVLAAALMVAVAPAVAVPPPEERGSDILPARIGLVDAWRLATDHDPVLKLQFARRDASVEVEVQARSQLLPQLGFQAYREDGDSDGERIGLTGGGIGLVSSRTESDTRFAGLQVRQPIVAVDRWIAMQQAGAARTVAELQLDLARETLALRVAQAYFGALAAADALGVAEAHLASVRRFAEQIGHRHEAGVVANTDLQEARAALDAAAADEIDARHRVVLARQALADLTGTTPGPLRPVIEGFTPMMPDPAEPGLWMQRAASDATMVRITELGHHIASREIARRRAAAYPTLDLVAARSWMDRSSTNPFETLDVDGTTVRLELNVPLFAGGAIRSRVRQADAEQREAGYRLEAVRLDTVSQARRAWLGIEAAVQRVAARAQALRSATVARQAAETGVVEGVRTTLDVLDAQRQYSQAQAALAMARYEYILSVFALRAATGMLDENALLQADSWLDH